MKKRINGSQVAAVFLALALVVQAAPDPQHPTALPMQPSTELRNPAPGGGGGGGQGGQGGQGGWNFGFGGGFFGSLGGLFNSFFSRIGL